MAQLTINDSNWNLSLNSNENNVILMTAGTYVDKNIKISLTGSSTDFQNYYTGNSAPSADLGNDGDIYFKVQN